MTSNFIGNFKWDFGAKVISQFSGFFIAMILARLLGPYDFGLVSMAMVLIGILSFFVSTGMYSAIIQIEYLNESHKSSAFFFNIFSAIILIAICFLSANYVANYFEEESLINIIKACSLILLLGSFRMVQEAIFVRNMLFKIVSKVRLVSTFLSGVIAVILAFYGFGVWSLVLQKILEYSFQIIGFWFSSSWRPKLIFQIKSIIELWKIGFSLFLASLIDTIYRELDQIIISKIFSVYTLGLFNRAKALNRIATKYSSDSVISVAFPFLSKFQNDNNKLIYYTNMIESTVAFFLFAILGLLYINASSLILLVLGDKWFDSIAIFKILCLSGFALPMINTTLVVLKSKAKSQLYLKVEVISKIIGLTGLIIGFSIGFNAFMYSLIITGLINLFIAFYYSSKILNQTFLEKLTNVYLYPILTIFIVFVTNKISDLGTDIYILDIFFKSIFFIFLYLLLNYLINKKHTFFIFNKIRNQLNF